MAYSVDTYSGSKTFVIEDGTIDSSLSVRLVGKNYSGYGEVQNENFVHLLENFASTTPPPRPINGQIWFDSSVRKIKFYDATVSKWRIPGGAEVNNSPPQGQNTGDLWWDEENRQLYGFDGTNHILIGPQAVAGSGTTELRSITVTNDNNQVKTVIVAYVEGEITFIVSKDSFTLSTASQIELGGASAFSDIKSGINLRETSSATGITTNLNSTGSGAIFTINILTGAYSASISNSGFGYSVNDRIKILGTDIGGNSPTHDLIIKITSVNSTGGIITVEEVGFSPLTGPIAFTNITGTTLNVGYIHWGTASSALGLVDNFGNLLTSNDFLRSNVNLTNFTTKIRFSDLGYTLGDSEDLEVKIDVDGTTPIFRSQTANIIKFQTLLDTPLTLVGPHILPGTANVSDLGSPSLYFRNVYASEYYGSGTNLSNLSATSLTSGVISTSRLSGTYNINITGTSSSSTVADQLKVGSNNRLASVDSPGIGTANTIACRDSSGNINAVYFQGIATTALFADLAEKYLADQAYDIGTVVVIGGEKEITACSYGDKAFGAVSANPAFKMNDGLVGGTYIALKGRVPVKVLGLVNKGDKLIAFDCGCAKAIDSSDEKSNIFAIALESNNNPEAKLVESVIL
jgi:hypothetical protein